MAKSVGNTVTIRDALDEWGSEVLLVFFLTLGLLVTGTGFLLGLYIVYLRIFRGALSPSAVIFDAFLLISGVIGFFFIQAVQLVERRCSCSTLNRAWWWRSPRTARTLV